MTSSNPAGDLFHPADLHYFEFTTDRPPGTLVGNLPSAHNAVIEEAIKRTKLPLKVGHPAYSTKLPAELVRTFSRESLGLWLTESPGPASLARFWDTYRKLRVEHNLTFHYGKTNLVHH